MIMKKIASGYYEGEYKGVKFEICKVENADTNTDNLWYWMIGNDGGHDHFNRKYIAIMAVKEYIDEQINLNKHEKVN